MSLPDAETDVTAIIGVFTRRASFVLQSGTSLRELVSQTRDGSFQIEDIGADSRTAKAIIAYITNWMELRFLASRH